MTKGKKEKSVRTNENHWQKVGNQKIKQEIMRSQERKNTGRV